MWKAQYEMVTDVPAEALYRAIADVNSWSKWDAGLEYTRLDGEAKPGAAFVLKPKGGPKVKMSIDEIQPHRLVDTAHLLGAKMRTTHEFLQTGGHTTIRIGIEVSGPLGLLWRKVVGENQIREAQPNSPRSSATRGLAPETPPALSTRCCPYRRLKRRGAIIQRDLQSISPSRAPNVKKLRRYGERHPRAELRPLAGPG
jgi:Polyketide cyclase / dehydrase and lipid transport